MKNKPEPAKPMSKQWGYKIGRSKNVRKVPDAYTEGDVYQHLQERGIIPAHPTVKIVSRLVTAWEFENHA